MVSPPRCFPGWPLGLGGGPRGRGYPELEAGGRAELLWGAGWVRLWAPGRSLMQALQAWGRRCLARPLGPDCWVQALVSCRRSLCPPAPCTPAAGQGPAWGDDAARRGRAPALSAGQCAGARGRPAPQSESGAAWAGSLGGGAQGDGNGTPPDTAWFWAGGGGPAGLRVAAGRAGKGLPGGHPRGLEGAGRSRGALAACTQRADRGARLVGQLGAGRVAWSPSAHGHHGCLSPGRG